MKPAVDHTLSFSREAGRPSLLYDCALPSAFAYCCQEHMSRHGWKSVQPASPVFTLNSSFVEINAECLLCRPLPLHFERPELSKTEIGSILVDILQNMVGRFVLSPWQLNLELGTVCVVDLIPICAPDFLKVLGYPCYSRHGPRSRWIAVEYTQPIQAWMNCLWLKAQHGGNPSQNAPGNIFGIIICAPLTRRCTDRNIPLEHNMTEEHIVCKITQSVFFESNWYPLNNKKRCFSRCDGEMHYPTPKSFKK